MTPQTSSSHSYLENEGIQAQVPTRIPFRNYERKEYDVEIAFQPNGDVVYHFFPKKSAFDFVFSERTFGMLLEDAFIWASKGKIDAEADFFDRNIAKHFVRANDPSRSLGQPTFCITLRKVGNRLGAEEILVDRFLGRLDMLLEKATSFFLKGEGHLLEAELKKNRWRN